MNEQAIVKTSVIEIFNKNGYSDLLCMTQRDIDHIGQQLQEK